ncbi:MAG: site-2 protease family protein [Actinomycetia bacterium]|nr:site-2 protease family protein [Actinomycetes bacterium]
MTDTVPPTPFAPDETELPAEPAPAQTSNRVRVAILLALFALVALTGGFSMVVVILALIFMIFLHELGHYVTARWSDMKVTEFFIGFGPRIWSFRRGETEYGLKAIPAGAYVKIIGMNSLDDFHDPADEKRTYRQATYPRRFLVGVAGSTMHFVQAFVLLLVLFTAFGMAEEDTWDVGTISGLDGGETVPAVDAGLELDDRIRAVDGTPVVTFEDLRQEIQARPGAEVTLLVERDGQLFEATTLLAETNPEGEAVGFLGIGPDHPRQTVGLVPAVGDSAALMWDQGSASVLALGNFFSPGNLGDYFDRVIGNGPDRTGDLITDADGRLLSPVGAVRIASDVAEDDIANLLGFLVSINIFVGIFNLIPLPPLDGGLLAVATYERLRERNGRRHHIDYSRVLPVTATVVVLLGFLGLSALYLDSLDLVGLG